MSLSRVKVKELSKKKKSSKALEILLKEPNRILTAILIMNNVVNIAASSIATVVVIKIVKSMNISDGLGWSVAISTGVMTFLILVFGEITPKTFAKERSVEVSLRVLKPIYVITKLLNPVIIVLMAISNVIIRIFGGEPMRDMPFLSEDEIKSVIDIGTEEGVLSTSESKIFNNAFLFKDLEAKDIMVPRIDIVGIEEDANGWNILRTINEEGYSRYPVYSDNIDNIIGVLYAKDILNIIERNGDLILDTLKAKDIMRKALLIPETKKISDILNEFKRKKIHIAIVIDEFGGTSGIVALEDVLEELVGEIRDEYDEEETGKIQKIDDRTYIIDSSATLNDFYDATGIVITDEDYETIGGYAIHKADRLLKKGEIVETDRFLIEVLDVEGYRITKIKLTIKENADANKENKDKRS
jgi:CBS domain containing-hemolysin-like protein